MTTNTERQTVFIRANDGSRRVRLLPRQHPDPQMLDAVRTAAESGDSERTGPLREAINAAREGGHRVTEIAAAAGISRQSVYASLQQR